jgi:O-antigen/teichoic acid export membrane protein
MRDMRQTAAGLYRRIATPLYTRSMYLIASTLINTVLGMAFWALAARSTDPATIGITNALISSARSVVAIGALGIGTSFIYYASGNRENRVTLTNTVTATGWLIAALGAIIYLLGIPIWAPGLLSVTDNLLILVLFVVYTCSFNLLGYYDSFMLVQQQPQYMVWRGIASNLPSVLLVLLLALIDRTYIMLFFAFTFPKIITQITSGMTVIRRSIDQDYRFFGRLNLQLLRRMSLYGIVSFIVNLLWGLPTMVLPLIAINTTSAEATGYFAISWSIFFMLLMIPRTVSLSFFIESSRDQTNLYQTALKSLGFILVILIPVSGILWFEGRYVLTIFGTAYADPTLLHILMLSLIPFTLNSIYFIILRARAEHLQHIIFCAIVAFGVVFFASWLGSTIGIIGIVYGWLIGHTLALIYAGMSFIYQMLFRRKRNREASSF